LNGSKKVLVNFARASGVNTLHFTLYTLHFTLSMSQFIPFTICIGLGFVVGIIYVLITSVATLTKKRFVYIFTDLIFFLFLAGVVVFSIYFVSLGQPRWYLFLGLATGLVAQHVTLGGVLGRLVTKISARKKKPKQPPKKLSQQTQGEL